MIRLINLVLSCERVVLICGCCTAHLRPQEGITWPLIEQHLKLRTAEVESSMHSYTNYCASTHSTRLHMLLGSQVKFTWIQMLMSQSHSMKNTFGRILKRCQVHLTVYSQALKIFDQTRKLWHLCFSLLCQDFRSTVVLKVQELGFAQFAML